VGQWPELSRCNLIGNDIVDLDFCEEPRYSHVRYLRRVCTCLEQEAVRRSSDPKKALCVLWAAKEAAYKFFSRQLMACRFVPRRFEVQMEGCDPARIDKKLSILYADMQSYASIFTTDRWVHAIATLGDENVRWAVRENQNFSRGWPRVLQESEAVRALAKSLVDKIPMNDVVLTFEGRIPQLRRRNGDATGMEVSLSHHGAFVAAAIAWPRALSDRQIRVAPLTLNETEDFCSIYTA
jgi:phosphopantetheinyl transferase (holo-ACP synthase)